MRSAAFPSFTSHTIGSRLSATFSQKAKPPLGGMPNIERSNLNPTHRGPTLPCPLNLEIRRS